MLEGMNSLKILTPCEKFFIFSRKSKSVNNIVIWPIKTKEVFINELTVPFEENFDWAHQSKKI